MFCLACSPGIQDVKQDETPSQLHKDSLSLGSLPDTSTSHDAVQLKSSGEKHSPVENVGGIQVTPTQRKSSSHPPKTKIVNLDKPLAQEPVRNADSTIILSSVDSLRDEYEDEFDSIVSMEIVEKELSTPIENVFPQKIQYPDHTLFDKILETFVSSKGNVRYSSLKESGPALSIYFDQVQKLPPEEDWPYHEKLAFWINVYNAFTIQLILDHYPIESILEIDNGKPWDRKWIKIGNNTYSLNQIEHEIIRPFFKEPRIHFALNCAARSCPPLAMRAFTANNLDLFLENRTQDFINDKRYNQISSGEVFISRIFDWYAVDFGDLIPYLNRYSQVKIDKDANINFIEYDWKLNQ